MSVEPMPAEDLAGIKAQAAEVVRIFGDNWPLEYDTDDDEVVCRFEDEDAPFTDVYITLFRTSQWPEGEKRSPLAEFLADSPKVVTALVAEVERLRCTDPIECGHEAALGQAEAELARRDQAAAEDLADQTMLRSLNVGPDGMVLDLAPAPGLVLSMVETAKQILGDAPNYTETPVTLTVSAAGEYERYAFVVQRVGNLTPHQAREKAEAERDRLRHALERAALSVEHDRASRACQERITPIHDEDCPACEVQAALHPQEVPGG